MNDQRNDRRPNAPAEPARGSDRGESQHFDPAHPLPEGSSDPHPTDSAEPPSAAAARRVRVDLHCHSAASHLARRRTPPGDATTPQANPGSTTDKTGDRPRTLPECATTPGELYEVAKRRGMDFVTITDHDTIAGVLELADQPDVFVSEELTAWFKGEPQAVHVLCFGITPDDHEWLQAHSGDLRACASYLHDRDIACALAHPFHNVAAPLTPAHRRTLAQLFATWETRNGGGAREMNNPAAIYIETHGGAAIGGSDDHAGIGIGHTYTEAPFAADPGELLDHIRAGRVSPHGSHGSAAQLAHNALALAARTLPPADHRADHRDDHRDHHRDHHRADHRADHRDHRHRHAELARRLAFDGDARIAGLDRTSTPEDKWWLLQAWLEEMDMGLDPAGLLAIMQAPDFSHADLERRARRVHEQKLTAAAHELIDDRQPRPPNTTDDRQPRPPNTTDERQPPPPNTTDHRTATASLLRACLPALPYIPAAKALTPRGQLAGSEQEPTRVAVIMDGVGGADGVRHPIAQLRERGIPGYELELIGTDANVDHRLPGVTELEHPLCRGLALGVPSLFAVTEALTERRYDLLHVCASSPAALAALAVARINGIPAAASFASMMPSETAVYAQCEVILSPGPPADAALRHSGIAAHKLHRHQAGAELERFHPGRYRPDVLPGGRLNILHVGRLGDSASDLLAEAFLLARDREPRLHLLLAGRGPAEPRLRCRFAKAATFLGTVDGDALARIYASADLLVFVDRRDAYGQVILEAQASGLPVLAVDAEGPAELIESGRSGCLVPPEPEALASAIRGLARRAAVRDRLATGGLLAVRQRGLERSLAQLTAAWRTAIDRRTRPRGARRAA